MTDPSKTIIVAGSGRSGTTWISNIITANWKYRTIFEPFNVSQVPEALNMGISLRPYCSIEEKCPNLYRFTHQALCGDLSNKWVDQQSTQIRGFNRINKLTGGYLKRYWTQKLVLKTIRATLLLPWIDKHFSCPVVYIIRHPGAVINSRLRDKWEADLNVYLSQSRLMEDYLSPYESILKSTKTEVQKHAIVWCVDNLIPLKQLPYHKWIFCTYEKLFLNSIEETYRILSLLKIRPTKQRLKAIEILSHVTNAASSIQTGGDVLTDWRKVLSARDIADISAILREFNITLYEVNEPFPVYEY